MPHPGDEWLAGEFPEEPDRVVDEYDSAMAAQDSAEELGYGDEITTDEGEV